MVGVADPGTATGLQIAGFEVGGKTGTAQLGTDTRDPTPGSSASPARRGEPAEVAVAVIVEAQPGASEQITGGAVAAPIAQRCWPLHSSRSRA